MTHIISSLLDYSNLYDLYLIDLWGLTHNGKEPFPTAINVFKELKLQGKTLIVISNAPRLPSTVKHLLQTNMNINADQIFDGMITSGLLCRQYIKQTYMGKKLYHIGSQNDGDIYEDLCKTSTLKNADFVLLTGTEGGYNSTESFTEVLTQIAQLRLPVLCANPDQYVYVDLIDIFVQAPLPHDILRYMNKFINIKILIYTSLENHTQKFLIKL